MGDNNIFTPPTKFICGECRHRYTDDEMLCAPNPFDLEDRVYGCPNCRSVDQEILVCDEPKCWKPVCCGSKDAKGVYRNTCHEHTPIQEAIK